MPKLLVHLWIADRLAGRYPDLKDPDFYLGSIAPDAVYSRNTDIMPLKNLTHLVSPAKTWERDVMSSFGMIMRPTLFELGYYMHIVTDIRFRKSMRDYYDLNNVDNKKRGHYDRVIIPIVIRTLFPCEQSYRDCVAFARKYKTTDFPNTITETDIKNNFIYADSIFEIKKLISTEGELDIPLPDYANMCEEVIGYLIETFDI